MSKLYKYLRFSTDEQDARQQESTIDKWLDTHHMTSDERIIDEAKSAYKTDLSKREIQKIFDSLQPNDSVIVSELSRLTRKGASELMNIIHTWFKPNKIRLILCDYNLDIDCTDMNPYIEMMLSNMATMARIERDMCSVRTKEAMVVRKRLKLQNGGWINNKGEWTDRIGREKGCDTSAGSDAAAIAHRMKKENDPVWQKAKAYATRRYNEGMSIANICSEMNKDGLLTRRGNAWSVVAVRNLLNG